MTSGSWCAFTASWRSERWARCCCSLPMSTRAIARRLKAGGMTATRARSLCATAVIGAGLLRAAPFDITPWKYRAPVRMSERGQLAAIPIDKTLYSKMRPDLADLRVVRDRDEVPYLIQTMTDSLDQ